MRCPFCSEEHPTGTVLCPKTQQRIAGILGAGIVIDEKYKILGVLGTGGMAAVYRAEHTKIGRAVALKLLLPEFVAYPDLVERVAREARAAGGIDHPNVVEIVDLGTTQEYGPYIAMELLKGEDLATYAEKNGNKLSDVETADIARQVLGALAAAHEKGVIHRDLKPENIFLTADDDRRRVKVLDFGISKLSQAGGALSSLTRTGTVMGTPQYMAPEQAAGTRDQDHRVDIYACGVVMYAVLTGALPYEAENYNLLINDILNKPPIAILARDKHLDEELAEIVMKAIARNPADRFESAKAMQSALGDWLNENSTGVTGMRSRNEIAAALRRVPSAISAPSKSVNDAPIPVEEIVLDEEPTTSFEAVADRPKSSPKLPISQQPTMPEVPKPPSDNANALRSNTRTPLGWENTPAGTPLPPPERSGRVLWILVVLIVLIGGGGVLTRFLAPATWNAAVTRAGMPQFATVTGDSNPSGTTTQSTTSPNGEHGTHAAAPNAGDASSANASPSTTDNTDAGVQTANAANPTGANRPGVNRTPPRPAPRAVQRNAHPAQRVVRRPPARNTRRAPAHPAARPVRRPTR